MNMTKLLELLINGLFSLSYSFNTTTTIITKKTPIYGYRNGKLLI